MSGLSFGPLSCALDLGSPGKRAGWVDLGHPTTATPFPRSAARSA